VGCIVRSSHAENARFAPDMAKRHRAGFSLLEVMAVLFLLALSTSVVMLSLPPSTPPGERYAVQMALSLERLQQEAILTSTPRGIVVRDEAVVFQIRNNGAWQNVTGKPSGDLRGKMPVRLEVGDAQVSGGDQDQRLVFTPDGLATPGVVWLLSAGDMIAVEVKANGAVSWSRR
jgi:type II secretion system protein H